jgi:hypothetical protein
MSVNRKVVHASELPVRLPIYPTITLWLLLDRTEAPGWVWGATGVLMLIVWIGAVIQLSTQHQTRIWPQSK